MDGGPLSSMEGIFTVLGTFGNAACRSGNGSASSSSTFLLIDCTFAILGKLGILNRDLEEDDSVPLVEIGSNAVSVDGIRGNGRNSAFASDPAVVIDGNGWKSDSRLFCKTFWNADFQSRCVVGGNAGADFPIFGSGGNEEEDGLDDGCFTSAGIRNCIFAAAGTFGIVGNCPENNLASEEVEADNFASSDDVETAPEIGGNFSRLGEGDRLLLRCDASPCPLTLKAPLKTQ